MVFLYTFGTFALYILLMLWISGMIYKMGKTGTINASQFKLNVLKQHKESGTVDLAVGYATAGFLISSLISIVYFLIAFLIYTTMWSEVCF